MTKNEKRYLRHVKSFMPVKGKTERRFLHSLRSDLDEFSTAHPDSSYETLTREFGSPFIREYDNAMNNTVGGYTNTIEIIETSE